MNKQQLDKSIRALNTLARGNFHPQFDLPESDPLAKAIQTLDKALERRDQEHQLLASITAKINSGLLLKDILDHVFNTFQEIIPYDRIGLALIDEEQRLVRACDSRAKFTKIKINEDYSAPIQGSSLEQIIETGKPRIINDLNLYFKKHPDSVSTKLILEEGIRSNLTCPLITNNRPVGFIFFSSIRTNTYQKLHIDLFLKIARQLSIIFEKSRLYERLLQLDELKNKFLGIAAHDLRSPIGVIKNFIILFLEGYLGKIDDKQREVLNIMDKNCDRMLKLTHDLLDFGAIASGKLELKLELIDPHEFFKTYHLMIKSLAEEKQIRLDLKIEPDLPKIKVDADRFTQILDNLVTNAIKFSHPNTTVTIGARRTASGVQITVADQGQGIPENEISKIFQEFTKTSVKPTAGEKSIGLGLAIVKRIIEAHNGTIEVNSVVGKGTTFTINLKNP
jgi:signal transduction histidine kinase